VDDAHAGNGDEGEGEAHLAVQGIKVLEVGAVLSEFLVGKIQVVVLNAVLPPKRTKDEVAYLNMHVD
jgi:hypothetical protein